MNAMRLQLITEAAARVLAQPATMRVICQECGKLKELKPCADEQDGMLSHGLHEHCVGAFRARVFGAPSVAA